MAQLKRRDDGSYYVVYSAAEGGGERPISQEESQQVAFGGLQLGTNPQGPLATATPSFGQEIRPITTAPPNATAASLMPSALVSPSQELLDRYRQPTATPVDAARAALEARVKAAGGVMNPNGTATYSGVYGSAKPAVPSTTAPRPGASAPGPGMVRTASGGYVPSGLGAFLPGSGGPPSPSGAPVRATQAPANGQPYDLFGLGKAGIRPDDNVRNYGVTPTGTAASTTPPVGGSLAPAQPSPDFAKRADDIITAAEQSLQTGGPPATGTARPTSYNGFQATPFPQQTSAPARAGQSPAGFTPTQAPTLPGRAALAARPSTFTPTAYTRPNAGPIDQNALGQRVEQELNVRYTPQREALLQASERARLAREQQTQEIEAGAAEQIDASRRDTAARMEKAREYWGAQNLGSSGFLAGSQAQAQAAAVRAQSGIMRDTERARGALLARGEQETSQLNQQLDTLASLRGEAGAARLAQLNTEERQFRLQEANQALGEWQAQMQVSMAASQQNQQAFDADRNFAENVRRSDIDTAFQQWATTNQVNAQAAQMARQIFESDRGFQESVRQFGINQALQNWLAQNKMALDQAQLGLSERQVGLAEERQSALLPGETARQALLNRQAALENERTTALLPSELQRADAQTRLAGTQASAANEELYRSNEAYRQFGTAPQALEFETAKLKRDAAKLELEIAQDPNVGSRATKQAALNEINARIRSSDALANKRDEPTPAFTPYQQYQMGRDQAEDARRAEEASRGAMEKQASSLSKQYDVGQGTAELWVAFSARLAQRERESGPVDRAGRQQAMQAWIANMPMPDREKGWLLAMAGSLGGPLGNFANPPPTVPPKPPLLPPG